MDMLYLNNSSDKKKSRRKTKNLTLYEIKKVVIELPNKVVFFKKNIIIFFVLYNRLYIYIE